MENNSNVMTFDLKISFEGFELKSGLINLKTFLNLNTQITNSIQNICSYSRYVNFAETIIHGFQICGSINRIFNHQRFIDSLKFFQEKNQTNWSGYFSYKDNIDSFVFYAPKFELQNNR
tara:strand:- start:100 stop:456 length:357 start_codon:yes stop_codon:yes gene_type:complete